MDVLIRSCLSLVSFAALAFGQTSGGLTVTTGTGTYIGLINGTAPNVRQFLNIPYSLPPTGERRWLPPAPVNTTSSTVIDATQFPPSCAQYLSKSPSVYSLDVPEFLIPSGTAPPNAGEMAQSSAEDCLSLAVWTPSGNVSNLPVIMFMTGGGFNNGGIDIQYQLPYHWVQRTQAHIVVTINYRVNILGFPNAAGLDSQNLGNLDQRMALEWVRDNIAAFGGDPSKITLWGQSAGAASVDILNFAYPTDPIAAGLFMESGTSFIAASSHDYTHSNFSFVASHFNCTQTPPNTTATLACMRALPASTIINFVGTYNDASTLPALTFGPIPDDITIFSNYTDQYRQHHLASIPAIVSNCADEGAGLVPYPVNNATQGPSQAVANALTLSSFICPSHNTSVLRAQAGLLTYRYQYAGNFSNISPRPWMGAYHDADLPMLFGTYSDFRQNLVSSEEVGFEGSVSIQMQDFVLEFMRDPVNGPGRMGWKDFESGMMLRWAAADGIVVENVSVVDVDGACTGMGSYDPSP